MLEVPMESALRRGVRASVGRTLAARLVLTESFFVSAAANVKTVGMLASVGPAESGGVAVMVLGKAISIGTAGEMGLAVRGVSG